MNSEHVRGSAIGSESESVVSPPTVEERNLGTTETIDVPVPSEELRQSVEVGDFVQVEEIPQHADHFSASYRRC